MAIRQFEYIKEKKKVKGSKANTHTHSKKLRPYGNFRNSNFYSDIPFFFVTFTNQKMHKNRDIVHEKSNFLCNKMLRV